MLVRGMQNVEIIEARTDWEFTQARMLFEEYAAELAVDLCFQNFQHELQNVRSMYSAPSGCLLLARAGPVIVGCVAYRPFQNATCEMKRLYVRHSARGADVGRRLTVELIRRARAAGYTKMLLDTLKSLKAAHSLYQSLGFREVEPYYANPLADVVFMELNL
jgi:ribosomal protein S18 acetylase RimI-like enzyme